MWYLLRSSLRYDVAVILLSVIFAPQLVYLFRHFFQSIVQLAFVLPHIIRRRRFVTALVTINAIALSALLFGFFCQSVLAYAAAAYNEAMNHEEISRQRLIAVANAVEATQGPMAAVPVLRRIEKLFPGDQRNFVIADKIKAINDQDVASRRLFNRAELLQNSSKHMLAVQTLRSSIAIAPFNLSAREALVRYQLKFAEARADIETFYSGCHSDSLSEVPTAIDKIAFIVRDPTSVQRLSRAAVSSSVLSRRLFYQLCAHALRHKTSEDYRTSLERALFKTEKEPEDE